MSHSAVLSYLAALLQYVSKIVFFLVCRLDNFLYSWGMHLFEYFSLQRTAGMWSQHYAIPKDNNPLFRLLRIVMQLFCFSMSSPETQEFCLQISAAQLETCPRFINMELGATCSQLVAYLCFTINLALEDCPNKSHK